VSLAHPGRLGQEAGLTGTGRPDQLQQPVWTCDEGEEPGLLFSPIESGAKFSIMEALEFGFRTSFNIVTSLRLLGRCILLYLTSAIAFSIVAWPVQEAGLHFMNVDNWFYTLFCLVVLVFLNNLLELAYINVLLRICEPGTPRFSDLYTRGHLVLDLLGLEFLIGSALPAGLLLLLPQFYCIPVVLFFVALGGFVFLLLVSMMSFFSMVDFETGPITSFQTSFALTKGARLRLSAWLLVTLVFAFPLIPIGMYDLRALAVCVLIYTFTVWPFLMLCTVHIYKRLLHETEPTELPEEVMLRLGKPARMKGA
ncbi:MAG: hypothetical protein QF473_14955, partial [Planctomycetota bacterium]|nr:hypothetical protein [Planctomycetota bacterium]